MKYKYECFPSLNFLRLAPNGINLASSDTKIRGSHGNGKTREWGWEWVCPGRNQHHPLGLPHPGPGKFVQYLLCASTMPSIGHIAISLPSWSLLLYQRNQMFGDYEDNYSIGISIQVMQKWQGVPSEHTMGRGSNLAREDCPCASSKMVILGLPWWRSG